MSLSSPGVGSGLDVKAIVDAYVKAETAPLQAKHDIKLKMVNTELSAIGQLKSTLSNLQTSLNKLSDLNQFYLMKYSLSDSDSLSASITPQAAKGTYQIEVQKLAQQQSLASNYIVDPSNVGSGAITITIGTYNSDKTTFTANASKTPTTINIAPGNGSLIAIRDAINNTDAGVTASIVQDNQGSRLTLTSTQTGENYAIKVSGGISALNYDPTTGVNSLTETKAALNSIVKVNGLILTQSTNQLKEAITGVTLNLKKEELNKNITLTVEDNKDQVTMLLNEFIKQYNDSITFLTNLTGYNTATKESALFQGDPQFRSIKGNLTKIATSPLSDSTGPLKTLSDIGIMTNRKGLLELNQEKYSKVVADNYRNIGALFAKTATPTDSNIRLKSVSNSVKAGSYDVELSAFTPGVSMTGTIGGLSASSSDGKTLKGSGDLKDLSIDVLSGSTGARGTVEVKDGLAVVLNKFLDTYTGTKGDLDARTTQLNNQVSQLAKTQDNINTRGASLNARYLKQFNALDILLTQLTNTSNSLSQQLASLPNLKIRN